MTSTHLITVTNDDGDEAEVYATVDITHETDPPYSGCDLMDYSSVCYCEWLTWKMVDDRVQRMFAANEL